MVLCLSLPLSLCLMSKSPRPPDSGKPYHNFFQRALISSKFQDRTDRIVVHGHKMESRIVIGPAYRLGSFAPGSRAETRLRVSEAGVKGLTLLIQNSIGSPLLDFCRNPGRGGLNSRNAPDCDMPHSLLF